MATDGTGNGSFVLNVRAYAPFDSFGGVYHGDGARRGPTTSKAATARIHAWVPVDLAAGKIGSAQARSSPSSTTILPTFKRTAAPKVSCKTVRIANGLFVQLDASGANPLAPPGVTPDIDVRARVEMTLLSGRLGVSAALSGDLFPNFELFLSDSKDARRMVLSYETDGGRHTGPMVRLWGARQAEMGGICASFSVDGGGLFQ